MLTKRRFFGQHFLRDQEVIHTIIEKVITELKLNPCQSLLEIGPGKGAITFPLFKALQQESSPLVQSFLLVEKDRELVEFWNAQKEVQNDFIEVEGADFTNVPSSIWAKEQPVGVVSNLPYASGTAIFQILAEARSQIPFMVLMFQAEVAHRLRAIPGNPKDKKDVGSLTLWTQNHWEVSQLLHVPPKAFQPPPKVDSEIVVLKPRSAPLIPESDQHPELWQKLLRSAFAQRRKMLRATLGKNATWKEALSKSGVDPQKRPEALSWEEWKTLFLAAL
jgi:16S rRNA (adenine1518-N6/adenine1519-N6)-dimethyltransferase